MLVLSRKKDEWIYVGNPPYQIRIVLVEIRGDKARIGVDAPLDTTIHRKEVWDAIHPVAGPIETPAVEEDKDAAPSTGPSAA